MLSDTRWLHLTLPLYYTSHPVLGHQSISLLIPSSLFSIRLLFFTSLVPFIISPVGLTLVEAIEQVVEFPLQAHEVGFQRLCRLFATV